MGEGGGKPGTTPVSADRAAAALAADPPPKAHDGIRQTRGGDGGGSGEAPGRPRPGDPDDHGEGWDPARHEPAQTREGRWKHKRGQGAAAADEAQARVDAIKLEPPPDLADEPAPGDEGLAAERAAIRFQAKTAAGITAQLVTAASGVRPRREEWDSLVYGAERMLAASGSVRMPPWLEFATAVGTYAGRAIHEPEAAPRIGRIKRWFIRAAVKRQLKRQRPKDWRQLYAKAIEQGEI